MLVGLGTWQWQRLDWKTGLIAERAAALSAPAVPLPTGDIDWRQWEFRRIVVTGRFLHTEEVYWPGQKYLNGLGVALITPLELQDGRVMLVNRGVIPASHQSSAVRPETLSPGLQRVEGVLKTSFKQGFFTPPAEPASRYWFWYDIAGIRAATGLPILPAVLESAPSETVPELIRPRTPEIGLSNNHLQYIVTWYGLALALVAVYIAVVRGQRNRAKNTKKQRRSGSSE